jgi:hypothetical protein
MSLDYPPTLSDLKMNKKLMLTLLDKGSNGEEILQILDSITYDESADDTIMPVGPTLEEIRF